MVLVFVVVYQQIENYLFLPRITARTMDLHPAVAFGSAIAGGAVLGGVGAILAIPGAAMIQALLSNTGTRHEVIDSVDEAGSPASNIDLTVVKPKLRRHQRRAARAQHPTAEPDADT